MTVPNAKDILSLSDDSVSTFIQNQANARTLSAVMRRLNDEVLGPDQTARQAAEQAITHLGFPLRD